MDGVKCVLYIHIGPAISKGERARKIDMSTKVKYSIILRVLLGKLATGI